MFASAAAASRVLRFSSATPSLAPLHRPLRRRLPSVRCSLAAYPGVRAPPELVDSILSKVPLMLVDFLLLAPFPDSWFLICFCNLAARIAFIHIGQETASSNLVNSLLKLLLCSLCCGWCWFVVREKYCWLIGGCWLVLVWCERKTLLAEHSEQSFRFLRSLGVV